MSIAAVILAAGGSTRLGEPKQLVVLAGQTLLERAVHVAREAGCEPVVVVLGALAELILGACELGSSTVVINADWEEGMAASIACGIATLEEHIAGAVVMACDQPAVTAIHLQALMQSNKVTASRYAGRHGVPAYFPAASFEDLLELEGDGGARELLKTAHAVDLPGGELDVDTAESLAQTLATYGKAKR